MTTLKLVALSASGLGRSCQGWTMVTSWPKAASGHEDRAEPDPVGHDLGPGLLGLLELEGLDARPDVGERREGHRLLGVHRRAARPAGDRPAADERDGRDRHGPERRGDDE